MSDRRGGLLRRVPPWARTVRFRLALLSSALLFAGMALVVGTIYAAFAARVDAGPVAEEVKKSGYVTLPDGTVEKITDTTQLPDFEQAVNEATLANLRTYSLLSLAALPVLSFGLGWVLSGRALRPVQRITDVAAHLEATDLSQRIALDGPKDELRRLADTFDRMLGRLDAAFAAQRQLVDDASHDLRNPLATLRTTLEVVLRDPRATIEDHRRAAAAAVSAVDRMSTIVDELLVLARQQTERASVGDLDLAGLAHDVAAEFRPAAAVRGVEVSVVEAAPAPTPGEPLSVRRALANLLDNAVRLAPPMSVVTVGVGTTGSWSWLAVADQGPGVPEEQRSRVFDRAWTAEGADGGGVGGRRGLGLAIVSQVAQSHGGLVRLESAPPGSVFVLWLPVGGTGPRMPPPQGSPLRLTRTAS